MCITSHSGGPSCDVFPCPTCPPMHHVVFLSRPLVFQGVNLPGVEHTRGAGGSLAERRVANTSEHTQHTHSAKRPRSLDPIQARPFIIFVLFSSLTGSCLKTAWALLR